MALRSSVAATVGFFLDNTLRFSLEIKSGPQIISLARNKQQSGSHHIKLSVIRNIAAASGAAVPSAAVAPPPVASPVEETPTPATATTAPPAVPVQATMVSAAAVPPAVALPPVAPMDVTSAFVQAMQNDDGSAPGISKADAVNALVLLLKALGIEQATVEGSRVPPKAPKYGKPYQQVLRKFKDEVSHADELRCRVSHCLPSLVDVIIIIL